MSLSSAQRGVALGAGAGLAISLAGLGTVALLQPVAPVPDTLAGRLALLALCALAAAATLAFCIARLASHRFGTPQDIDGSGLTAGSDRARLLQALLQNTLEQLMLALPVHAAWVVLAPARVLAAVPVAAAMFVTGRVLFFWGYGRGAPGRALGFALTFYPTVIMLAGALCFAIRDLLG